MKLLIAYDGSSCSEAALDDLMRAGLPDEGEALVISVAEVWLPPPPEDESLNEYLEELQTEPQPFKSYKESAHAVAETRTLSCHAKKRFKANFPNWEVTSEATYGSPAWEILNRASDFAPDLIVVGSHGRSAFNRLILGSISQKILTEASSSVRIARGRIEVDPTPVRIIIGFDASEGAQAAVQAVAARKWREGSEVKLIAVADSVTPSTIGRFIPPINRIVEEVNQAERDWIENLADASLVTLSNAGLSANLEIHTGNPKSVLVEGAEKWSADCIFVGANAYGSRLERFLLGSVSSAVASRAHCSVEVVRKLSAKTGNNNHDSQNSK
jgi:nucleotide-binding universal stress UspA family protein